jgi:16S rRNA (guanine1516-N2)-methyltransferase
VGVGATSPADQRLAEVAAATLQVELLNPCPQACHLEGGSLLLQIHEGIPQLRMTGPRAPGPVVVGFEDNALASRRRAGHNELLGRAIGWRHSRAPRVLDATAGFGRDAFVLADLGCDLLLCERNPVMAFLLEAALCRCRENGGSWLREVASRMSLRGTDARSLADIELRDREVIYLDPMFSADRKSAPGKEMQLLHLLTAEETSQRDSPGELLEWALEQPVQRVVVKRPRRESPLAGVRPGHSLQGRSVRFDVYPLAPPTAADQDTSQE